MKVIKKIYPERLEVLAFNHILFSQRSQNQMRSEQQCGKMYFS